MQKMSKKRIKQILSAISTLSINPATRKHATRLLNEPTLCIRQSWVDTLLDELLS